MTLAESEPIGEEDVALSMLNRIRIEHNTQSMQAVRKDVQEVRSLLWRAAFGIIGVLLSGFGAVIIILIQTS